MVGNDIISDIQDDLSSNSSGRSIEEGFEDDEAAQKAPALAQRETVAVSRSKALMLIVLAVAASLVAYSTYRYTSEQEYQDFQVKFLSFADQILQVTKINTLRAHNTYNSWSVQLTTLTLSTGARWPFVQIPQFERQGHQALLESGAKFVGMSVLVSEEEREEWEKYAFENQGWIEEGLVASRDVSTVRVETQSFGKNETGAEEIYQGSGKTLPAPPPIVAPPHISSDIMGKLPAGNPKYKNIYAPKSQFAPLSPWHILHYDIFNFGEILDTFIEVEEKRRPLIGLTDSIEPDSWSTPSAYMITPVFESFEKDSPIRAILAVSLPWDDFLSNLVPESTRGLVVVIHSKCSLDMTFEISGSKPIYIGPGDLHEPAYDRLGVHRELDSFPSTDACSYTISIYPSDEFQAGYESLKPVIYTISVGMIFLLTALAFVSYDLMVERRQRMVLTSATRSNALVSSLFPEQVRDRLLENAVEASSHYQPGRSGCALALTKDFSAIPNNHQQSPSTPIAELFSMASVLFMDIAGFTSWSSQREPTHVFQLLEGIYNNFDRLARKRGVFKVETIGDCYVAATGLPIRQTDHAERMCRFTRAAMIRMSRIVQELEVTLGPGTSELCMRAGIHSGPVTAGVLRGEKSRFQLFGDTVNVAARMESTGVKRKTQVSNETAQLLISAEKESWLERRPEPVLAKGKGELTTWWLLTPSISPLSDTCASTTNDGSSNRCDDGRANLSRSASGITALEKSDRLIDWNTEVLSRLLKRVVLFRKIHAGVPVNSNEAPKSIPELTKRASKRKINAQEADTAELSPVVLEQLRSYVVNISYLYPQENTFHNFEHASNVVQATSKLLRRVVEPDATDPENFACGITSDPVVPFACAFSSLIHDVDHPGVTNAQLIKERSEVAAKYQNTSIAEKKSIDIAWELLMQDRFSELRSTIYTTQSEHNRFREIVASSVLATDIADKDLELMRKEKWDKAFDATQNDPSRVDKDDQKTAIVIEYLMQASDVSHTMQHWHVYAKWNEKLFHEIYQAYCNGRSDTDPSVGWFEGEIAFFDKYVIPLAQKLKESGLFGVSGEEFLQYATANRSEWEQKGKDLVSRYRSTFQPSIMEQSVASEEVTMKRQVSLSSFVDEEDDDDVYHA